MFYSREIIVLRLLFEFFTVFYTPTRALQSKIDLCIFVCLETISRAAEFNMSPYILADIILSIINMGKGVC